MATPREVIDTYIESVEPAPIEKLHRDLSVHMRSSYLENREGLEKLVVFFQIGSLLLVIEIALWLITIALA